MKNEPKIYIKDNNDGTQEFVLSNVKRSDLGHYTGSLVAHIFSHKENKVVCGAKSFHGGGLQDDIDIELAKEIGIQKFISCKRCQMWFRKHYV